MLRSDTTALFERLREANILLQEVLSGAHENMSAIENTLVTRVSEFVATMNEVAEKHRRGQQPGRAAHQRVPRRHQQGAQRPVAARRPVRRAWPRAGRGGRADRHAATAAPRSTVGRAARRRIEYAGRRRSTPVPNDLEQRAQAVLALLDESLEGADRPGARNRPHRRGSSTEGARAIAEQFERSGRQRRGAAGAPPRRWRSLPAGEQRSASMFAQAAERFAEVVAGSEADGRRDAARTRATRTELRHGILELPQETADSAAQMRRVIVDQIEALAELNRIVARHGRGLDAVEPAASRPRRIEEPDARRVARGADARQRRRRMDRAAPARPRGDITGMTPACRRAAPKRRRSAPASRKAAAAPAGCPTC